MDYRLEEFGLDLGTTPVENMFINTYLSLATGNQLKVYLFAYAHAYSKSSEELTNEMIASQMDMTLEQVEDAWSFWAELGVVSLDEGKVTFTSLRNHYIKQLLEQKEAYQEVEMASQEEVAQMVNSPLTEEEMEKSLKLKQLFDNIEDYISDGGPVRIKLKDNEINYISNFIDEFNLEIDFINYAFPLASTTVNSKNPFLIMGVIRNWIIDGARDMDSLNKLIEEKSSQKEVKKPSKKTTKPRAKNLKDDRMTVEERKEFIRKKMSYDMDDLLPRRD